MKTKPQIDLRGEAAGAAQLSMFGDSEDRLAAPVQRFTPDPEDIRRRLNAILDQARAAQDLPWGDREARMWQTVFPNMANWLPPDEAERIRLAFSREMERLFAS